MKAISGLPIDYGCDWITATGSTKSSQVRMQNLGNKLLREEAAAGNILRGWGFSGYEGFKCGSVQLGTRADSTCLRVGSGLAFENWSKVYHAAENFTRVDLQLTLQMARDPQKIIPTIYRRLLSQKKKKKNAPQVTLLKSSNGTSTVYLGQRQSERYLRCYDKGRESKLDYFHNSIRFETELKGPLCLSVLRAMSSSKRPAGWAALYVSRYLMDRGLDLGQSPGDLYTVSVPRRRTDAQRRLRWLEEQVSGSVRFLVASGHLIAVRRWFESCQQPLVAGEGLQLVKANRGGRK